MRIVLVGMFRSWQAAQAARTDLAGTGFTDASMTITPAAAALTGDKRATGIKAFFCSLFGADGGTEEVQGPYDEAFGRGRYALTVTAETDADVDRAEDALNAAGVIDIAETAEAETGPASHHADAMGRVRHYKLDPAPGTTASREPPH